MFRKESLCLSLVGFLLGSYSCSFSLSGSSSDSESVLVMSIVSLLVFLCFFVGTVDSVFSHSPIASCRYSSDTVGSSVVGALLGV
jgi:hypothetical protein